MARIFSQRKQTAESRGPTADAIIILGALRDILGSLSV
jgi:hypothetical protein